MHPLQKPHIYAILLPFACLYRAGVTLRNWCFKRGILTSRSFALPVICVGNISVGGTGKTPHTEYLIRLLSDTFQVAVLSRGYKRKSKGFVLAQQGTSMEELGDEPFQMWGKYPQIKMAVDRDRCHGIEQLSQLTHPQVDVIVLDDAFQHRYVKPGLTLLLIDYNRPIFRDALLPAGRLREPQEGKERADIIIVSKCPEHMGTEEQKEWYDAIAPLPHQQVYFTTFKYRHLYNVFQPEKTCALESLSSEAHILLLTGIASPAPLISKLSEYTRHITPLSFPDHHMFTEEDIQRLTKVFQRLPEGKRIIFTTDKDAVRIRNCRSLSPALREALYTLPIEVGFLNEKESLFNQNIMEYVRKNSRNSCLSEG